MIAVAAVACGTGSAGSGPGNGSAGGNNLQIPADFEVSVYRGDEVLGGEDLRFSELFEQDKPVILNFWAGECPPCRAEMPDLQAFNDKRSDEVLLFGLDIGPFVGLGSRDDGQALIDELGITYPTGTTFESGLVEKYRVLGMPTTVFLKPDGEVHRTWSGLLNEDKLNELADELVAASGSDA